ncbi:MAG: hypothetical protein N3F09_08795 [Bacteroidia bacterium]|nr:hypothetical protein [Bacteroidia bacterium]
MKEIHVLEIQYVEPNQEQGINFHYKPDVPKLKLVGTILEQETEEEETGILFLTQNQLYKVIQNKEIDLKWVEDKWIPSRPLTPEQIKRMGLVDIHAEFLGLSGDLKCFEALEVKN